MPFNFMCPGSRGLSLALSRRLLQATPYPLVTTARKGLDDVKAKILNGLDVDKSRVMVLKVDVTDEPTLSETASQITKLFPSESLQYAFSAVGILHPERSPADLDAANIKEMLSVNLLGQLLVLKHFSPFLPTKRTPEPNSSGSELRPAVWANMSARVGSISNNRLGGWYSYRATKAGVNSMTKTFDIHLSRVAGPRAFCVSLHPGTVKTELSREFWGAAKEGKLFSPEFAAERLVGAVVGRLKGIVLGLGGERGGVVGGEL